MIVCLDVDYQEKVTRTAAVGFLAWTSRNTELELVVESAPDVAEYEPGEFYKRELPRLLEALVRVPMAVVTTLVVDGYVWLAEGRAGLGAHLHHATNKPVVGIAKTHFSGSKASSVYRGQSTRPLYVTSVSYDIGPEDMPLEASIRAMHGDHRLPTMLTRVDNLARGYIKPSPTTR